MFKKFFLSFLSIALFLFLNFIIVDAPNGQLTLEAYAADYRETETTIHSRDGTVSVDISNTSKGYIQICYSGNNPNVKVIISKDSNASYPYWIQKPNEYKSFNLTFGNGEYQISVLEQTEGNYFSMIFSERILVNLEDSMSPFLYPNFFVDYTEDSAVVKYAATLRTSSNNDREFIENVYNLIKQYPYDYAKGNALSSSGAVYKTDLEEMYLTRTGICLDYAAVMVAMLRSQGIPAKLEFGYIDDIYHSWVNVYIPGTTSTNGHWEVFDPTFANALDDTTLKNYLSNPNYYNPMFIN